MSGRNQLAKRNSTVPPRDSFLKEVTLQGDFEISDGHF